MDKAKGIAICIGLNSVDPNHYQGWSGPLVACEADAEDMTAIAKAGKYATTTLLTKKATRAAVTGALKAAAGKLKAGDTLLLTYSGHGGQVPDANGDEDDDTDETWCLYDGQLVDDELYALFGGFARGVRILVLSDSCHSGTVTRAAYMMARSGARGDAGVRYRFMPPEVALRVYRGNQDFYDDIAKGAKDARDEGAVAASVILISGCQDNQLSQDGAFNGLFTGQLLKVWNGGRFRSGHRRFHANILTSMPPDQSPNYYVVGAANKTFERKRPFTI